jgi:hypothetical protein
MADSYTVQKSLEEQSDEFLFQSRQYSYITDSNNSSYNQGGQVILELSGISNSGKYLDTNQSYISIPLVTTLYAVTGSFKNDTPENAFAVSLKNGYTSLISSLQVECTNNSVTSVMQYSNVMMNFKNLTEMSVDDTNNYGASIGFQKDDVIGTSYQAAASAQGLGTCNNIIKASAFDPSLGYGKSDFNQNKGRLERMKTSSYDPSQTGESPQSLALTGKSFCQTDGLALGKVINYYTVANLPLAFLADFFMKFPLCKGMYLKIILNLNCNCSSTMTVDANGLFTSVVSSSQNGQVPYMISPINGSNGLNIQTATPVTKMELSIGIARNSINSSGTTYSHPTLSSCRVYCCLYDFSPQAEQMYLSKQSTKTIKYSDFLSFQTLNISAGSNFNQILTNSIARPRRLIGVPQIAAAFNFAGTAGTIAPANSPFSTCPNTTASGPITNYNVLVSGTNLYQQNLNYSVEHFIQELRKTDSVNGGMSLGMSSGLLDQLDYESGYRFLVSDLSRCPSEASDNISRSIQVIGTNSGKYPIDILWFLEFEREVTIDLSSGSLIA